MNQKNSTLLNRVLRQGKIDWEKLDFIQSDTFKELSPAERAKLKQSMISNSFVDPFKVWHDTGSGKIYCLDGKHRTDMLHELKNEGYSIPGKLPATFIECSGIDDAAKLVLIYSSHYAQITQDGLSQFLETYHIPIDSLNLEVSFPALNELLQIPTLNMPAQIEEDMFFINIKCVNETHCNELFDRFSKEGLDVKIVR